jgi:hypothetical protein
VWVELRFDTWAAAETPTNTLWNVTRLPRFPCFGYLRYTSSAWQQIPVTLRKIQCTKPFYVMEVLPNACCHVMSDHDSSPGATMRTSSQGPVCICSTQSNFRLCAFRTSCALETLRVRPPMAPDRPHQSRRRTPSFCEMGLRKQPAEAPSLDSPAVVHLPQVGSGQVPFGSMIRVNLHSTVPLRHHSTLRRRRGPAGCAVLKVCNCALRNGFISSG